MSNPMRYIKDLEAAGFERHQAEAQVQMVLDAIEGDLVRKSDFAVFQEQSNNRFAQFENRIEGRMDQFEDRMENRFGQHQQEILLMLKDLEFRMTTRLGLMTVSVVSIGVALMAWIIKV